MPTPALHAPIIELMHAAKWDEARTQLEQALASDPADVRAWRLLGTVGLLCGRPHEALEALERALTLDADNTSTLLNLGSVYLDIDRAADAMRCFQRVVALEPMSADGHFNLGLAAQGAGRDADAEQHWQRALQIDADADDAKTNLAALCFSQARHEQCAEYAKQVLDKDPAPASARILLLRALMALGDLASADHALAQIPAGADAHAQLQSVIGKLHSMNGRLAQAAHALQAAIELGDERTQTRVDLAACLLESGEPIAAAEQLRTLIERDGEVADHHALLGLALRDAGEREAALQAYENALRLAPRSVHFLTAKANLLFELGRRETAESVLDEAIAGAPAVVSPHMLRIEQLIGRGDVAAALQVCEHYLNRIGAECNMLASKAFLLHALGQERESAVLLDYDRLVSTTTIEAPEGYASVAAFNAALVEHLLAHPSLSRDNAASKATQNGRQSGNLLFGERGPFADFEQLLWRAARGYVTSRGDDSAHPFLADAPTLENVYAWAVVLDRAGYQTPHIHPTAWLSGVYYPKVPAITDDDDSQRGWIEFGAPPPELELEPATPVRRVKPHDGLLILFPSYFYHRTLPWDSDEARISIAFDFSGHARR